MKGQDHQDAVRKVTARIDAIGVKHPGVFMGLSWWYIQLIFLTGIGWAMDSMETFIFTYTMTRIAEDIPMTPNESSFLGGAVFVGSFIGSFPFGNLADKFGRRMMFMVTMVLFLIGLGLCGAAWNFPSIVAFRIISGIGLGGELPVASTLVQELSPKKTRGKIIVLLEAFWAIGVMLAVLLAFGLAPKIGWRETFWVCLIPVLYSIVIRFWIPESPKWLASVGRYEEAFEIVEMMERKHDMPVFEEDKDTPKELSEDAAAPAPELPESHLKRIELLFKPPFTVRTIVLWTLWIGISMSYYAIFVYLPSLIALSGYDINGKWENILIITACQLPGYFSAAALVEVIGRRMTLVVYLLLSFVSAIALGYVPAEEGPVMVAGCLLSFFILGAWGCVYSYTPENYPTAIRGMGSAYPSGFSRIGAFSGPYLCAHMFQVWEMSLQAIMWVFGGILVFVCIILFFFGYEPKGKDIESWAVDSLTPSGHFRSASTPDRANA